MRGILLLSVLCLVDSKVERNRNRTVSNILDQILTHEKYDKRLRPNYEDGPVIVLIGFWVLSIDSINVVDMDYTLDIFLRQSWKDERLQHDLNATMFLSNTVMDRLWMPDSYFVNAKKGSFHKVTKDNMMIMIEPGGMVRYNARITIRVSCPMNLRMFPMDTQHCPLILESYGYSTDHIIFKWEVKDGNGLGFVPSNLKMLPQYKLTSVQLSTLHNQYVVGNWSGIKAMFTFQRMYSYFVIHVYGPCALIVVISWLSFLLPREQPPARITLGVTSVLTVVTILNMLNNSMPKVNYVKTIDKYLIGCFLFVFLTLVEYSIVLWLVKAMKRFETAKQNLCKESDEACIDPDDVSMNYSMQKGKNGKECSTQLVMMELKEEKEAFFSNGDSTRKGNKDISSPSRRAKKIHCVRIKELFLSESFLLAVDDYSLVMFPVAFFIFNAFYWLSIISISDIFGV